MRLWKGKPSSAKEFKTNKTIIYVAPQVSTLRQGFESKRTRFTVAVYISTIISYTVANYEVN
jgi:hypothetical protein